LQITFLKRGLDIKAAIQVHLELLILVNFVLKLLTCKGDSGSSTTDTAHSPHWLSSVIRISSKKNKFSKEAGIKFTSANQFVTIKPFSLYPSTAQYYLGSLTMSFWIQRTRNNGGYIFRYSNSDVKFFLEKISIDSLQKLSYDYFLIKISDDGYLSAAINLQTATTTTAISSADWTLVSVTFALHPLNTGHYITINIAESSTYSEMVSAIAPSFVYNSQDKVRIGGPNSFKGSISDFRIYSPGSGAIIDKGNNNSQNFLFIFFKSILFRFSDYNKLSFVYWKT